MRIMSAATGIIGELESKTSSATVSMSCSRLLLQHGCLPLMANSRLKDNGKGEEAAFNEFELNPHFNRLFTAILRAEVRLTLAGWRWPAGGGRIVVGRAR